MKTRILAFVTLALAGCTATGTGTVTPGASAGPGASTPPTASAAPGATPTTAATLNAGDFVPTTYMLSIDGKPVAVQQRGNVNNTGGKTLGVGLGAFRGEKAGMNELITPTITITSQTKTFDAADFTQSDATGSVAGLNWVRNLTARTYIADDKDAKKTFSYAGGKFNVSYSGKMSRSTGSGDFPESIQVELVAEGIPTK
jgi:hypothetical protein